MSDDQMFRLREQIASTSDGSPSLEEWRRRISDIPYVRPALDSLLLQPGIGTSISLPVDNEDHSLVVGWYLGRVEFAYLSL